MVGLMVIPRQEAARGKAKVPLDCLVGDVLDYLKNQPSGGTVEDLAATTGVPAANIRKVLSIIAIITSKVAPLFFDNAGRKSVSSSPARRMVRLLPRNLRSPRQNLSKTMLNQV